MDRSRLVVALAVCAVLGGTGCRCAGDVVFGKKGPPSGCSDEDGDGYGVGADCAGSDCNDFMAEVHADEQCSAWCEENPDSPGCACDAHEPRVCYLGPLETVGVGPCASGIMTCEDGTWRACVGQVLPDDERCNGEDDDCDGENDDGVLSACGDCNAECEEDCMGVGCPDPIDPDSDGAQMLVSTPGGGVTLDGNTTVRNHVIWIANSTEGTVSKIDTRARVERARYWTGPEESGALSPSRTTVSSRGDAVVANRSSGGADGPLPTGSAAKFYASDCPDVDEDGTVETSTGADDVLPWGEDECLAWATPVGVGARGSSFEVRLGLDGVVEEYVWVGDSQHLDVHEIDSETGEPTGRVILNVDPYGLAIGRDGVLWTFSAAGRGGGLVRINTTDEALAREDVPTPDGETWYGITVDSRGRVWIGGTVARYDPETEIWESPDSAVWGGGIACDGEDNAFVGDPGNAWKVDGETLDAVPIRDAGGRGWAVDFDGFIWSIPLGEGRGGPEMPAVVTNPDTLEPESTVTGLVGAYTYSDMTGFQLANVTRPTGILPIVFEGCEGGPTRWASFSWEGVVPEGTSLGFSVRTADDLPTLAAAVSIPLGSAPTTESPVDLAQAFEAAGVAPGRLLRLEVIFRSVDGDAAPVLDRVAVSHSCEDVVG